MAKVALLLGEVMVCKHSANWVRVVCKELDLSESEAIERIINGYVHSWHGQFEVPLASSDRELATAIRKQFAGGSHV